MTDLSTSAIKKMLILFLVFAGLHFAQDFLIPLVIGAVLAMLFLPFCTWMELKKIPKGLAVMACLFTILVVIAGVFTLLGWQVIEITQEMDLIKEKAIQALARAQAYLYHNMGISIEKQTQMIYDQQPFFTRLIQDIAGSITYILSHSILILIYVVFLLYYRNHIKQFILKLAPNSQRDDIQKALYRVAHVAQQYLLGLSKMIVCLWIMYGIGFSVIGLENALFFAFLCGLLEIVPFVGNLTGTTITILGAMAQGAELPVIVSIALTYALIQFIQGWFLEPLIVGSQVKINPLFTIIALVIGELLWGIPGIFLAIPLMAMFKITCDHIEPLKPYGFLIGETETKSI